MNLHAQILHQFPLFDIRFLICLVNKTLNFPKLKQKWLGSIRFNFIAVLKRLN